MFSCGNADCQKWQIIWLEPCLTYLKWCATRVRALRQIRTTKADQIAHAQSDQGLGCPYTETTAIEEYIYEQWRPRSDCANAQSDLGHPCSHMTLELFSRVDQQCSEWKLTIWRVLVFCDSRNKVINVKGIDQKTSYGHFYFLCSHPKDQNSWDKLPEITLKGQKSNTILRC